MVESHYHCMIALFPERKNIWNVWKNTLVTLFLLPLSSCTYLRHTHTGASGDSEFTFFQHLAVVIHLCREPQCLCVCVCVSGDIQKINGKQSPATHSPNSDSLPAWMAPALTDSHTHTNTHTLVDFSTTTHTDVFKQRSGSGMVVTC